MQDAVLLLLQKLIQRDMMLPQRLDIYLKAGKNFIPRILEDSVSLLEFVNNDIVENPELKPQKDYDDYTKYVNDDLSARK